MRLIIVFFMLISPIHAQELRGHGGAVRALALQNNILASGSFDQSIILWDKEKGIANNVLRGHEGAVTTLLFTNDLLVSGGEDGRVIFWKNGKESQRFKKHEAQITGLAVYNETVASSAWDGRIVVYGATTFEIKTPSDRLIGLGFKQNGELVAVGSEGDIYHYAANTGKIIEVVKTKSPVTSMLLLKNDQIVLGLSSGAVKFLNGSEITVSNAPIIKLTANPLETLIAAASIGGTVTLVDLATSKTTLSLNGPGLPVWSVLMTKDEIITGGNDRTIRHWDRVTGEHKGAVISQKPEDDLARFKGERGAEVFRACASCHSLTPDGDNKAGPSLYKIIDAEVASKVNYNYSEVLLKNSTIWTENNIKKLFDIGPNSFFPGTKMPEQRITSESDRQALVDFLKKASQ